jgi:S1-C subfamily serine protease
LESPKIHAQDPGLLGTPTAAGYRIDTPDVVATHAGIQAGDTLVSIGDNLIHKDEDVGHSPDGREAGEEVVVHVNRDGKPLKVSIALDAEPLLSSMPFADLPTLFEHDMPLPPSQCGGPVIDLDGKAVGITMYRGQYGCMAIPADCIERLLPDLRSGKLADIWDAFKPTHAASKSQ